MTQLQGEVDKAKLASNLVKGTLSAQGKKEAPGGVMGAGVIGSGARALPESGGRRLFNSGSTAGYTQVNKKEEPQSYQSLTAANDSGNQRICRQLLGPMHQKNSQSFIYSEFPTSQQNESETSKKLQAFDKRQRSYRNDSHILSHKQPSQAQYFNIQRDMHAQLRLNHAEMKPPGQKAATFTQQTTPQVQYQMVQVYQQSPNSAIHQSKKHATMKDSHSQFNRSHQGDGFHQQFDSINPDAKRGGSYTNTGQGPRVASRKGNEFLQPNGRLVSFDC